MRPVRALCQAKVVHLYLFVFTAPPGGSADRKYTRVTGECRIFYHEIQGQISSFDYLFPIFELLSYDPFPYDRSKATRKKRANGWRKWLPGRQRLNG